MEYDMSNWPLAKGVVRAAPMVSTPPSLPTPPPPPVMRARQKTLSIVPTYEHLDPAQLTTDDLRIITQGKVQVASDNTINWRYESRREAQPILDFLYLGPSSVLRDRAFLQREGITLLLAVRDSRMAKVNLMGAERVAGELGIEAESIDVDSNQDLVRWFPVAVEKINGHLLRRYRSQGRAVQAGEGEATTGAPGGGPPPQAPDGSRMVIDSAQFRPAKVLVYCETGNDRSAAVVAAYLVTMFQADVETVCQFIGLQRFCATFDESTAFLLKTYEDIIVARRSVARDAAGHAAGDGAGRSAKRTISQTRGDEDDDLSRAPAHADFDQDRYAGRGQFAPW
ncbi:hypothetical protein VTK73DRAFT_3381 [Phialemonium thermophilum]|uniref:Tyrosine-protein phosphatase domain-containing protein n=1 Tax=Phialemonium thermophilum TaxID=223376 RepID=A0ABR3VK97_9PEZI